MDDFSREQELMDESWCEQDTDENPVELENRKDAVLVEVMGVVDALWANAQKND